MLSTSRSTGCPAQRVLAVHGCCQIHNMKTQALAEQLISLEKQMIGGCLLFALIQFIQSSVLCANHSCEGRVLFGVIGGLIAISFCIVLWFMLGGGRHLPAITAELAV